MDRRSFLFALCCLLCARAHGAAPSNFHAIYDDPVLRDRFFLFLQNVFHLYPEDKFHQLILDLTARHADDRAIYLGLLEGLPAIKPVGADLTYAVPSLQKQKEEMARQAKGFLGDERGIDGYVEIGTTGRYLGALSREIGVKGPVFLLNDTSPGYGPVDILERGSVRKKGTFVQMGNYDPVSEQIGSESIDLVSNFIGFHHCPPDRLEGFVAGLRRVLRPGGRLLVREHDVTTGTMDTFVALAHDVFNAGVRLTWEDNAAQLRAFRSVADWTVYLEGQGFRRSPATFVQDHDPTDNVLLEFVKA